MMDHLGNFRVSEKPDVIIFEQVVMNRTELEPVQYLDRSRCKLLTSLKGGYERAEREQILLVHAPQVEDLQFRQNQGLRAVWLGHLKQVYQIFKVARRVWTFGVERKSICHVDNGVFLVQCSIHMTVT